MDKVIRHYSESEAVPMSTKEFIKHLKGKIKDKKTIHNESEHVHGPECNLPPENLETSLLVIVVDDVVVDVMRVQSGFGDMLIKRPTFVKVEEASVPPVGSLYLDGEFKPFSTFGVTTRGMK